VAPYAVRPPGHLPLSEQRTELKPDVLVSLEHDVTDHDLPKPPLLAVELRAYGPRCGGWPLSRVTTQRCSWRCLPEPSPA
jgi:hypothetical protein